jgi:AmmeMemoRadiSam system protein A
MMAPELKARLFRIARQAVGAALSGLDSPPSDLECDWPDPLPRGVFVTLRRGRKLRGCIGTFAPQGPLPRTVWEMAAAAARDPRFVHDPLSASELGDLRIEISVLSPLERTSDPHSLKVGTHGVYLRSPDGTGCFLPDVATEFGWNAEQFLSHCCTDKAMLATDAWRDPRTEVYLFTVEKIAET